MTITLMLDERQAKALEEALSTHLREMAVELARTDDRTLRHELHGDLDRVQEVHEQLSRRRRFLTSVLGHQVAGGG